MRISATQTEYHIVVRGVRAACRLSVTSPGPRICIRGVQPKVSIVDRNERRPFVRRPESLLSQRLTRHRHRTEDHDSSCFVVGPFAGQRDGCRHPRLRANRFVVDVLFHFVSQSISAGHLAGEVRLA